MLYYMISCTLILSHRICALCTHETNEPKKVERTSTLDYVCEYIQNSGRKHLFLFSGFFSFISHVILNRLLVSDRSQCFTSCFCFLLYVFFLFICSAVYFFSSIENQRVSFFFCVCICVRKPRIFGSKYIEIKYLCKERVSKFQSCKHGKYAQQSEHYGERILDLLNFDCKPNKGMTNQMQLILFYEILIWKL